jgi:hypothetical protein
LLRLRTCFSSLLRLALRLRFSALPAAACRAGLALRARLLLRLLLLL